MISQNFSVFDFHLVSLTETFKVHDSNLLVVQDYNMIYNRGNCNQSDGVIIYSKNYLDFRYEIILMRMPEAFELNIPNLKENSL